MKHGGEAELRGDLAHRTLILESQRNEQAIRGTQLGQSLANGSCELRVTQRRIRPLIVVGGELLRVDLGCHEILQAASREASFTRGRVLTARSAITAPVIIEQQTSRDDHEPRRESRSPIGHVRLEARVAVSSELLDDVGESIHCLVAVAGEGAAGVQEDACMGGEEFLPGLLLRRVGRRPEQAGE